MDYNLAFFCLTFSISLCDDMMMTLVGGGLMAVSVVFMYLFIFELIPFLIQHTDGMFDQITFLQKFTRSYLYFF